MESMLDYDVKRFTDELSSKAPVPGGGGASALVGGIGAALGAMVGNLTVGKKKYADVEAEAYELIAEADKLRAELLALIDADAEVFAVLAKCYSIPKDDPERDAVMEPALKEACEVPMQIMRTTAKVIELHERFEAIGSALAISDVGVGAVCCVAALEGASLNVFINTKSMKDREHALAVEAEADEILATYVPRAQAVYERVVARLREA